MGTSTSAPTSAPATVPAIVGNAPLGYSEKDARALITTCTSELERALPKHIPVDLLLKAAMNSVRKNPELLNCSQSSFIAALMHCAETGLIPDTPAQEAHLVPFNKKNANLKEATFIPGYRGLIKLSRQSGEVNVIEAHPVFEGDEFDYELGLTPKLRHKPAMGVKPGEVLYAYAIGRLSNGQAIFEVMSRPQIDKIRAKAPGGNAEAWTHHFPEQARKTVLKRLIKYMPQSNQLAKALLLDNEVESRGFQTPEGLTREVMDAVAPEATATDGLAAKIGATPPPEQPPQQGATPTGATAQKSKGKRTAKKKPPVKPPENDAPPPTDADAPGGQAAPKSTPAAGDDSREGLRDQCAALEMKVFGDDGDALFKFRKADNVFGWHDLNHPEITAAEFKAYKAMLEAKLTKRQTGFKK